MGIEFVSPITLLGTPAQAGDVAEFDGESWRGAERIGSEDAITYGDKLSSAPRAALNTISGLGDGNAFVSVTSALRSFSATKLRLLIGEAAEGAGPWTASIRDATDPLSLVTLADVPVTTAMLTTPLPNPPEYLREAVLTEPLDIEAGKRYALVIHSAAGAFSTQPTFGAVTVFAGFVSPYSAPVSVSQAFAATPPSPLVLDTTWTRRAFHLWWGLA